MQPIPVDSASLVKTRSHEQSCLNFFGIAVKKRVLVLVIILCLQAPVLYYFYTSEVTQTLKKSYSSNNLESSVAIRTATACTSSTCKSTGFNNDSSNRTSQSRVDKTAKETVSLNSSSTNTSSKILVNLSDEQLKNSKDDISNLSVAITDHSVSHKIETTLSNDDSHGKDMSDAIKVDEDTPHLLDGTGDSKLPSCPNKPPGLQGFIDVSFADQPEEMKQISEDNPLVAPGGYFKPHFCDALWKVAIIIPFRDREEHLRYFLQYMHPTLQRQQLEYRIYIVNQFGKGKFNRAKLMNVGYAEAIKDLEFACFVFHDVDLILENDNAIYNCPEKPRHLSVGVDKFNYQLPYTAIFGGVTELTREQFKMVNGYSNSFWGWGGEDDDMYNRIKLSGMSIMRYPGKISRYRMISHGRESGNEANPQRFDLIRRTGQTMKRDGLSSLQYKVVSREDYPLYTNVTVDLLGP